MADIAAPDITLRLTGTQRRFLAAYGACASITQAARWAKVHRQNHYDWLRDSTDYSQAFDVAEEKAMRSLEDEAVRRAHEGLRRAVRYKGRIVGYDTEYSDTLLIFLLKGGNRKKFGDKWQGELTGKDGKPLMDLATARGLLRDFSEDETNP